MGAWHSCSAVLHAAAVLCRAVHVQLGGDQHLGSTCLSLFIFQVLHVSIGFYHSDKPPAEGQDCCMQIQSMYVCEGAP